MSERRNNDTFHSRSCHLDFEVDGDDIIIRHSADSINPNNGSMSSMMSGNSLGSIRNLLISRKSQESLARTSTSSASISSRSSHQKNINNLSWVSTGSRSSHRSRRGDIAARSNGSRQTLTNAEFHDDDDDDNRRMMSTSQRPFDRRALLLGSSSSKARTGSSCGDADSPATNPNSSSTSTAPRRKGSFSEIIGIGGDKGSATSGRSRRSRRIEISHEETLAILVAQELDNLD